MASWWEAFRRAFGRDSKDGRRSRPRRQSNLWFKPRVEQLEDRTLLSHGNDLFVITHGWQTSSDFPAWVEDMATAIAQRAGYSCTPISNAIFRPGQPSSANGSDCDHFLVMDWADHSDTVGSVWREAAVTSLTDRLVTKILAATGPLDLHFVGHSRGAVVNSQVIGKLDQFFGHGPASRVGFLQMTTLDPYPVALLYGDPDVFVGPNVDFADNYYQIGGNGPNGRVVDGAVNVDVTDRVTKWPWDVREYTWPIVRSVLPPLLETAERGGRSGLFDDHSEVHDWYHWTVDIGGSATAEVPPINSREVRIDGPIALVWTWERADPTLTRTSPPAQRVFSSHPPSWMGVA